MGRYTAVWDVKDYGTLPEGADLSDGRCFSRGYAAAVGALFEALQGLGVCGAVVVSDGTPDSEVSRPRAA